MGLGRSCVYIFAVRRIFRRAHHASGLRIPRTPDWELLWPTDLGRVGRFGGNSRMEAGKASKASLEAKSDSVSALILALKLRARGAGPHLVARELALELAEAVYMLAVFAHLRGCVNLATDELSRKYEPGRVLSLPACLSSTTESQPARRDESWWRTRSPPQSQLTALQMV